MESSAIILFWRFTRDRLEGIKKISEGAFGSPVENRELLVESIYEHIKHRLVSGQSLYTTATKIRNLRKFFTWCENNNQDLSIESLELSTIAWSNSLIESVRLKKIKTSTATTQLSSICPIFSSVLELTRGLRRKTSIPHTKFFRKTNKIANADKQSLEEAFTFGHFLYDITRALPVSAITGALPVKIQLRSGQELIEWSKLRPEDKVKTLSPTQSLSVRRDAVKRRTSFIANANIENRHPLINLRLEAELLIFIAETGMNLATAYRLPYSKFSFKSIINGYEMRRIFKKRAQGEIIANVHAEYREVFDEYVRWRNEIFPNTEDGLLFPFHTKKGKSKYLPPQLSALRVRCKTLGIRMIGPRTLRKLKINFILRETQDPNITAEYAQHSLETLFRNYNQPSHQIAMIEISKFHDIHDPTISASGPGVCIEARPIQLFSTEQNIPIADCQSPSGCLFCLQNRDIEGHDHLWSLLSFQHLKIIELSKLNGSPGEVKTHRAYQTIQRISEKVRFIEKLSSTVPSWLKEARQKIREGYYHPKWDGFIRLHEHST